MAEAAFSAVDLAGLTVEEVAAGFPGRFTGLHKGFGAGVAGTVVGTLVGTLGGGKPGWIGMAIFIDGNNWSTSGLRGDLKPKRRCAGRLAVWVPEGTSQRHRGNDLQAPLGHRGNRD